MNSLSKLQDEIKREAFRKNRWRSTFETVNSDMLDSIKQNMTAARVIVVVERTCLSCGARTIRGVLPCDH